MMRKRTVALVFGITCHLGFLSSVFLMGYSLFCGMDNGLGRLRGGAAVAANLLLLLQFPLLHSALLTRSGGKVLNLLAPKVLGDQLRSTLFVIVTALQLVMVFLLWSPSEYLIWEPAGWLRSLWIIAYGCSWLFLAKAMLDADITLQTGLKGWYSVFSGIPVSYKDFPVDGLFKYCRQPLYLGFALVLLTAPRWTADLMAIWLIWLPYCFVGPRHKESRYLKYYGTRFADYQNRVPYFIPLPSFGRKAIGNIPGEHRQA